VWFGDPLPPSPKMSNDDQSRRTYSMDCRSRVQPLTAIAHGSCAAGASPILQQHAM